MKLTTHFDFSELVDLLFLGFQYHADRRRGVDDGTTSHPFKAATQESSFWRKKRFLSVSVISLKMALGGILGRQCSTCVLFCK